MNYEKSLEYITNLAKFGFNLGLDRIEKLLQLLGNPEKDLKVIHVGGTNGKGSTSAMLGSILKEAGFQVGIFTSPHLHCYRERTSINGKNISEDNFARLITKIEPLVRQMVDAGHEHPTEFEVSTALTLLYFYEQQVDLVILEVGLGGEIDSTNVVDPLLSVITNVTMEHMEYLGDTIAEIATVKAGIIKEQKPIITATDNSEVLGIIQGKAKENNSQLYHVLTRCRWEVKDTTLEGIKFSLSTKNNHYGNLQLSMLGSHQLVNCATAITVIEVLQDVYNYSINLDAIHAGLKNVKWAARLEIVSHNPMVVIDGAHNVAGAKCLSEALTTVFKYEKLVLVFGMLADKEREKVVNLLAPLAKKIVVTKPNSPRSGDWQQVADEAKNYTEQVWVEEDVSRAVQLGIELAEPDDLVCICGSLYMVAKARENFRL